MNAKQETIINKHQKHDEINSKTNQRSKLNNRQLQNMIATLSLAGYMCITTDQRKKNPYKLSGEIYFNAVDF